MFNDYISLTKYQFKNSIRRNTGDRKKKLIMAFVMFIGIMPLLTILSIAAYYITPMAIEAGIFKELLVVVLTGSQLAIFFFGIFSILAYMFFSEDAEFLAALPVNKTALFTSKLTLVYISELIISAMVLIPMLIVMGIAALNNGYTINAGYFVLGILATFLMPIIPLLLVSLLAFPMMYVVSFFKRRAVMSSIVLITLFVTFMMIYLNVMGGFASSGQEPSFELGENFLNLFRRISSIVFFNTSYANAMLGINPVLNTFIFLLVLGASLGITVMISSMLYHTSVMAQLETPKENGGKGSIEAQKEVAYAYLIKDFKMLIRNPGFAFQSFMGPILTPIMVLFMSKTMSIPVDPSDANALQTTPLMVTGFIIFLIMMLLCGTNFVASVAFTREGKYFYFNKYLPIPYSQIIKGKFLFATLTGIVGAVFATVMYMISVDTNLANILMFLISLMILSVGFSYMGIYRDLRKPKLEWNNVNEAVKQNLNAMFPMMIGSIIGIFVMVLSTLIERVTGNNSFLSWSIMWIAVIIPAVIVVIYYKNKLDNNYVTLINNIEL